MVFPQTAEHDLSMTTKLAALHNQLSALKHTRSTVRLATAFAGLVIAVLWVLVGIFVLDVIFELPLIPRLIVMVIGAFTCYWAFHKFTQPMLGVHETELDIALMVERQQKIDSDLVAAIQFESPQAAAWGSRQLETAVIDYVAEFGSGLNVFEGFSREQITRRATVLGVTVFVLLAFVVIAPSYARVFLNRLLLGSLHYPSNTVIEQILVNNAVVLEKATHGSTPVITSGSQGQPMLFYVQCSGVLPAQGALRVRSAAGGAARQVDLLPLTNDQRVSRLRMAQTKLEEAIAQPETDIAGPWQQEVSAFVAFDAPETARELELLGDDRAKLPLVLASLKKTVDSWPGDEVKKSHVYLGDMGRLVDDVRYDITLGDAWTDSASVRMTPLPVVELTPEVIPPKYARVDKVDQAVANQRQLSVLEGSEIQFKLASVNGKPLQECYLIAKTRDGAKKYSLTKTDEQGLAWALPADNTPFKVVTEEIRYELQVTDQDGLHLETPVRGVVRLRADRPPTGSAEVVHRVVLPTAKPKISYRLNDDYGISKVLLKVAAERASDSNGTPDPSATEATRTSEQDKEVSFTIHAADKPPLLTTQPIRDSFELDLAPLGLVKGDRLKLSLEVTDYRGAVPGQTFLSDPLILEISDESGVLAAISEADERSEQRLTDIIKKQLGIGESP